MQLKSYSIDKQGVYRINNLPFYVKPYYLVPKNAALNAANPEQITMLANGASGQIPVFFVDEGAFEGAYLSAQYADERMLVTILDDVRKRPITGRPCYLPTIFGNGLRPAVLPESIFLDKRESLIMNFTDLSGDVNNIRPVIHGQRIYTDKARDKQLDSYVERRLVRARYIMPYFCPLDTNPAIAGNASQDVYFTQDGTSHFEVKKLTYCSTGAFKFKIKDEAGEELTNDWVHATAGLGTAQYPFITYGPWMIRSGGIVTFTIEDLSGQTNTVYLTLIGRQLNV